MPSVDLGKVVGNDGVGIPSGGSVGQVLVKQSASNYDTKWGMKIDTIPEEIGIVCDGDKCAVSATKGQFIIVKNSTIYDRPDGLYIAAQAIPANTVIDYSYLTATSGGGLNILNQKQSATVTPNTGYITSANNSASLQKQGHVAVLTGTILPTVQIPVGTAVLTLTNYLPDHNTVVTLASYARTISLIAYTNGTIKTGGTVIPADETYYISGVWMTD